MTTQRRSYESGHKPKCLVIVDDSAEWDRAVYYASRWAIRVGGGVVMLRVIETEDQNQQWLGVADIMRAEAEEAANEALDRAAGRANGLAAITPERVIREGDPTEQVLDAQVARRGTALDRAQAVDRARGVRAGQARRAATDEGVGGM